MKSIALLLAAAQAVALNSEETVLWIKQSSATPSNHNLLQFDQAEGPTKADNGESDQDWFVLQREHDTGNGTKASGWTNPLGWADNGDDDDNVL